MRANINIFLNKLKENQFIEIFRFSDTEDSIFDDYQRYDFYQLLWFTKVGGDGTYFLDFNEYTLEDNQIVLVFPGQIDKLDIDGKEGYVFAIDSDTLFQINQQLNSNYLNGYFSNTFLTLDEGTKNILERLMELFLLEYNTSNRTSLMRSYMGVFLGHISYLFENSDTFNNTNTFVDELMNLIDKHFIDQRETDFYAEILGSTNKKVNELSKKGTGRTVKQHLQSRLILEIKKEIRLGEKNLKEIAFDLGFSEPSYFTRFFKQQTKLTPTEFRDS